ncbi:MAG: PilN domain-containing protein [Candidatus Omnitrophica bacterium]|nr:PilN domain-containing protein [Candidatus Omnitrophota bacterium]
MNLFRKKRKIITGLEISNRWVKLIQIDITKGSKEIVCLIKKDIKGLSSEEIVERVKRITEEVKIDPLLLFVSIPRHSVTSRTLELPSTNPEEIRDMVDLQIGKQTPYSSEDVISNHQIISSEGAEGYSRVVLAIVHKDIVQRQLDILGKVGLKTDKVGLSSEGLLRWGELNYKEAPRKKPYILIDVDHSDSDFEVILEGKLVFSKSISVGAINFKNNKEEALDKLKKEINRFVYDYHNEVMNQDIERAIITGANLVVDILSGEYLPNELGITIKGRKQFENVTIAKENLQEFQRRGSNVSFTGCFGLLSGRKELDINFLPREIVLEKEVKKRAKDIYIAGILLILVPIFISGIFLERVYNKRIYLDEIENRLKRITGKTDKLSEMIEQIKLIKKEAGTSSFSLDLLFEVYKTVSPALYLISISYDEAGELTLRGTSEVMAEVFQFVKNLEESKYFKNVKTKYANVRKVGKEKEVVDFEIVCEVKNGGKVESKD